MKKILLIALFVLILIGSSAVFAQQEVIIDQVFVELRPEYDTPEILIVYSIMLSEELDYPVDLSVKIPASSGGPSAVWEVVDGAPVATTFDTNEEGVWISVNVSAETPLIYIDFYDPEFNNLNSTRSYTYQYPPGLKSEIVDLAIWQPARTESFQTSIEFPEIVEDELGIIYHMASLNPDELDGYELDLSYRATTVSDTNLGFDLSFTEILPWVLGILGVGLLALGIFNISFKSGAKAKIGKKKYANKSRSTYKKKNKFCHNCGANISSSDKFCSECGAKTR